MYHKNQLNVGKYAIHGSVDIKYSQHLSVPEESYKVIIFGPRQQLAIMHRYLDIIKYHRPCEEDSIQWLFLVPLTGGRWNF